MREDNPRIFPSFKALDGDADSVKNFFERTRQGLLSADKPFADYWDEALTPDQSDALLGMYIVLNGLRALEHPVLQKRLEFSQSQIEKLPEVQKQIREIKQSMWANFQDSASAGGVKQANLVDAIDLRLSRNITAASRILSENQKERLAAILRLAPRTCPQRLSFGF